MSVKTKNALKIKIKIQNNKYAFISSKNISLQ